MRTGTERSEARCGTCFLSCSIGGSRSAVTLNPMCSLCQLQAHTSGAGALSYVMLVAAVVMWGSSFALTKVAIQDLSPLFVGSARCMIGAIILIMLCLSTWQRAPQPARQRTVRAARSVGYRTAGWVVVGGVSIVAAFMLVAFGMRTVDSGSAGVVLSTMPIWTIALASALGTERSASWWSLTSAVVLGSCAVLVLAMPVRATISATGVALLTGAALAHALSNLSASGVLRSFRPLVASALLLSIAAVAGSWLGALSMPSGPIGWTAIAAVIALGVLPSGLAYAFFFAAVAALGPVRAALANYLMPPVSVLIGVAGMGEPLGWTLVGALLLAIAALAVGSGVFEATVRPSTGPVPSEH